MGMRRYGVGVSGAAPSGAVEPHSALWNPSADIPLFLVYVCCAVPGGTAAQIILCRITTRGTPGSTVTPDADNDFDRELAPPSGAEVNLADFTVAPTVGSDLDRWFTTAGGGSVDRWFGQPDSSRAGTKAIEVPPGTGLSLSVQSGAVITEDTWMWDE